MLSLQTRDLFDLLISKTHRHMHLLPSTKSLVNLLRSPRLLCGFTSSHSRQYGLILVKEDEDTHYLRDPQHLQYHRQSLQNLLQTSAKDHLNDYTRLRSLINRSLNSLRFVTLARAYHRITDFTPHLTLNHVEELIRLSFSRRLNQSYDSLNQEQKENYENLAFGAYFEVNRAWNEPSSYIVLNLYLESYMNVLQSTNLIAFAKIYDNLREKARNEVQDTIMQVSQERIFKVMRMMEENGEDLGDFEMSIYLCGLRTQLGGLNQTKKRETLERMVNYLLNQKVDSQRLRTQNCVYCLFLGWRMGEQLGDKQSLQVMYDWFCTKYTQKDKLIDNIVIFEWHQDKNTCLKLDSLLFLQSHQGTAQQKQIIKDCILRVKQNLLSVNCQYWRLKYLNWFIDSLLHPAIDASLAQIKQIFDSIQGQELSPNDSLISLFDFLKDLTRFNSITEPQVVEIHVATSHWLACQKDRALASQNHSHLLQVLMIACQHPSLITIYTPYILRLLELSLGRFCWVQLTQLYYLALVFNIEQVSESGKDNMEYVRRYILNEYAAMGMRRHDIPQDSYFYKIHALTTPQKFYKNYLDPANN